MKESDNRSSRFLVEPDAAVAAESDSRMIDSLRVTR